MNIILLFIFGLAIGSFLNVVVYRFSQNQSLLFPASHCPHCKRKIKLYDNIPLISFIILRGRCRFCQKPIAWQYPLVEFFTALIFVWLYWQFGLTGQFFTILIFALFLVVIFLYDLKYYLILDRVTIPAAVLAILLNYFIGADLSNLFLAGLVGAAFFGLQYFVSGGRWVGGGDIRLGALMGLMLGWPLLVAALFISYLSGAVIGLILIGFGKKKMSSQLPFGAILAPATLVTLVYGQALLSWYLNLINL
ncbi:MAG: hypothetical protein A3A24_02515 [Candidatus Buchananbacteria bacterium RIFCSPLOWO2_01_FULL_46_12]|uniref:Prepilin peptidase n=1 Tax=Candidatus Buchananbacteria bacterium RIFCSPLOWO2_01_FULL_46_12 TaxID=1797546 RepID=A0A1G1YN85_9BACT|nr:MAG: hypothetical protein A3A24_02515 [Candidatus Buchananbacteria bacterium RIFCSPLOWO2_01_FULL_46_12]